tara:strand:- start:11747 stop:12868 length:1122 start_codon:yes stop_codon:yes gene_type:complete
MTTIEQLIGDLLLQNNCVIVPSFGGFVAQQVSARIDYDLGRISPPKKSLLFNKQLVNNDGLLINELANLNKLSFDDASLQVAKKVEEWSVILSNKGRIELDKIGFLYKDKENNLCFEQDRFFNLLLDSFGLKQIQFIKEEAVKTIAKEEIVIEKETRIIPIISEKVNKEIKEENTEKAIVSVPQPRIKVWKYIAAAVILPIAFYSVWIPMKTDVLESGILSFKDFNPFQKTVVAQYEHQSSSIEIPKKTQQSSFQEALEGLPEDIEVYSYKYDDTFFIPVKTKATKETISIPEQLDNSGLQINVSNYIVGCFGNESNANKLVAKLQLAGLDARIVDVKNGLHRVSAGAALSTEMLEELKSKANDLGFKGWTLK